MKFNVYINAGHERSTETLPPEYAGRTLTEARHLIRGLCDGIRTWGKPGTKLRIAFGPADRSHEDCVVYVYGDGTNPSIPVRHCSWPQSWSEK